MNYLCFCHVLKKIVIFFSITILFPILSQFTTELCIIKKGSAFNILNIMKTHILIVILSMISIGSFAQKDKKIELNELPQKAQVFIKQNFTKEKAQQILKETGELIDTGYDVVFKNKLKIKFDRKGDWKEVDGKRSPIPTDFIPDKIIKYIQRSFPNNYVVKIEREKRKYEVEITNGLELEFDLDGNFIKIDS